ncbi:unnamed protein product [Amoebophrya sp. A25]|nr:unnamed protein product [Amoebophrya sp. A25]|eukprot:GSA25T00002427001.1
MGMDAGKLQSIVSSLEKKKVYENRVSGIKKGPEKSAVSPQLVSSLRIGDISPETPKTGGGARELLKELFQMERAQRELEEHEHALQQQLDDVEKEHAEFQRMLVEAARKARASPDEIAELRQNTKVSHEEVKRLREETRHVEMLVLATMGKRKNIERQFESMKVAKQSKRS